MNLIYPNEKTLLTIAKVLAALFWIVLFVCTFGTLLIYILFIYLFFLFAHSAFVSYFKGSGVKITQEQYPDLYERLISCSQKVGVEQVPDTYLLRTDFFNAFATRFLNRHYIVLYTDVVDALEDNPEAVNFYIGHELGHIHRNHLFWMPFLAPVMFIPLLGAALRRAEEYTCDRYGAACCEDDAAITAAIAAIAAGDSRWKTINKDAYIKQVDETNSFWMSFHELTGDYPWLSKRMKAALAFANNQEVSMPSRHPFAWFLALFVPRLGVGGGILPLMFVIAIIGILAAIALPAYQQFIERSAAATADYDDAAYYSRYEVNDNAHTVMTEISVRYNEYYAENGSLPQSLLDLGYEYEYLADDDGTFEIGIIEEGTIGAWVGTSDYDEDQYLYLQPSNLDTGIEWQCYGENIDEDDLPYDCSMIQ